MAVKVLKDSISKNMYINKKINKLDEEKIQQDKTLKSTPTDTKKEFINEIISKKKERGFYDIHT